MKISTYKDHIINTFKNKSDFNVRIEGIDFDYKVGAFYKAPPVYDNWVTDREHDKWSIRCIPRYVKVKKGKRRYEKKLSSANYYISFHDDCFKLHMFSYADSGVAHNYNKIRIVE